MPNVQIISLRGRFAAAIIASQAIIEHTLSDDDFRHVQAKCLYAMEIIDGDRPGPYTDAAAEGYARAALAAGQPAT